MLIGEVTEYSLHNGDFFGWAGYEDDAVLNQAFALTVLEELLRFSLTIQELPSQTIHSRPAELVAQSGKSKQPDSNLDDNSRLYSAAIVRFRAFRIAAGKPLTSANVSAQ